MSKINLCKGNKNAKIRENKKDDMHYAQKVNLYFS